RVAGAPAARRPGGGVSQPLHADAMGAGRRAGAEPDEAGLRRRRGARGRYPCVGSGRRRDAAGFRRGAEAGFAQARPGRHAGDPSHLVRRTGADALSTMPAMDTFTLRRGRVPLLIGLPHDSPFIPADIAARMRPSARRSPDTDRHVGRLYEPLAQALGASMLRPLMSRYVVDLNRPADGHALYPGQRETGLVPLIGFDGEPLYTATEPVDAAEVQQRVDDYWRPYH